MKKVIKTILMGAVAFSLAMGVGCGTGENSSLEKGSMFYVSFSWFYLLSS